MAEKDHETEKLELSLFRRKKKQPDPAADSSTQQKPVVSPAGGASTPSAPAPSPTTPSPPGDKAVSAPRPKPGRRKATKPVTPPAASRPAATTPAPTAPAPAAAATPAPAASTQVDTEPVPAGTAPPEEAGSKPRTPRVDFPLPALAPPVAALVVGAVVGLAAVALTFASLLGCELVTGTDSCGGPGLLVLLAVVVLMILGGAAALRQMDVPDSGGLSFLGVAMFVAVCLVVLLPSLLEPWMIVVAPVLCALTFALAQWVVTRFDEDVLEQDGPEQHDVR